MVHKKFPSIIQTTPIYTTAIDIIHAVVIVGNIEVLCCKLHLTCLENHSNMSWWASPAFFTATSSSTLYLTVQPWATFGNTFAWKSTCIKYQISFNIDISRANHSCKVVKRPLYHSLTFVYQTQSSVSHFIKVLETTLFIFFNYHLY